MRLLAVVLILTLSGCLNDFDDAEVLNNYLTIQSIDVAAPEIRSGTLQLVIDTTLDNEVGRSGDIVVEVKAFDMATGLLVQSQQTPVGTIAADKTAVASTALDLPRAPGYRLEVRVSQDDRIVQVRTVTMNNLHTLPPNLHETGISIGSMDFFVDNTTADRALITASLYVTNEGTETSAPLRVQVKAREVTTSLIADQVWIDLPAIPSEETHPQDASLNVPQGFNYEVEAVVWDGNFIVGRSEGNVQLLPTRIVPEDSEVQVIETDVGRFSRGASGEYADEDSSTPGPGIVAIIALIGGIAWIKKRN